jgi:ABC-type branched-chain amino acid transport systems, ATPase component
MVPEGRGIFSRMSIVENMQMGAYLRNDTTPSRRTSIACSASSRA